jgi:hypothetical protein
MEITTTGALPLSPPPPSNVRGRWWYNDSFWDDLCELLGCEEIIDNGRAHAGYSDILHPLTLATPTFISSPLKTCHTHHVPLQ